MGGRHQSKTSRVGVKWDRLAGKRSESGALQAHMDLVDVNALWMQDGKAMHGARLAAMACHTFSDKQDTHPQSRVIWRDAYKQAIEFGSTQAGKLDEQLLPAE